MVGHVGSLPRFGFLHCLYFSWNACCFVRDLGFQNMQNGGSKVSNSQTKRRVMDVTQISMNIRVFQLLQSQYFYRLKFVKDICTNLEEIIAY